MSKYGSNGVDHEKYYAVPSDSSYSVEREKPNTDMSKWLKNFSVIIGIIIALGGITWGSASLISTFVTYDDHNSLKQRIEDIEKNDIKQTTLLESIDKKIDSIEKKLDRFYGNNKFK